GLSVEWAWFFSLILANSSKSTPPYLWPYSMPICANTPGIVSVPMRPSTPATAPYRPRGVHSVAAAHRAAPARPRGAPLRRARGWGAAGEQPRTRELLDADREANVALAGLHRHDRGAQ